LIYDRKNNIFEKEAAGGAIEFDYSCFALSFGVKTNQTYCFRRTHGALSFI